MHVTLLSSLSVSCQRTLMEVGRIYLLNRLIFFFLFTYLFNKLFIYLFIYLFIHLSIYLSINLFD